MTAATATAHREHAAHAPVQPMLVGIPEAPIVPEIRSSMIGQLQRHAEVRITPDGEHAHLVVQVVQPRHRGVEGLPFVCVYTQHQGDLVALQARAALMTTGSLVLVLYRGLDFDAQARTLRTRRCDHISLISAEEAPSWLPELQVNKEHFA